ncbi:MAG TPA: VOC family protein [Terriglobales bacterium]|nr:VOC family protein [Terriglobales bacterium]
MTAISTIGISKLDQVAINVQDLNRATAFYRDILQLQHLFTAGDKLAFFNCAGTRLMLSKPEKPEFDHPGSILYFKVPDIHSAHALLVEKGVQIEDAPHLIAKMGSHDLWMFHFHDSENNLLALSCELPPQN